MRDNTRSDPGDHRTVEEMRRVLVDRARRHKTISYSALGELVGMHHRNPRFMGILAKLCEEEVTAGRVHLCPLVVGKSSGYPGIGYFGEGFRDKDKREDLLKKWREDMEHTCAFWDEVGE